jgi:putative ATP-dependent endonuclease of OLD family
MFHRIHYVAKATLNSEGIISEHYFEDAHGSRVPDENSAELIRLLSSMNPVLRLRDSRSISALVEPAVEPDDFVGDITDLLPDCTPDRQQRITDGVHAAEYLLDRYFMNVPHQTKRSQSLTSSLGSRYADIGSQSISVRRGRTVYHYLQTTVQGQMAGPSES